MGAAFVSFFEELPPPPEPGPRPPQPPWMGPPRNEVGVAAGIRLGKVHEDRIAISVVDVVAYTSGFEVDVRANLRETERRPARPTQDSRGLRFGVLFSDGRKGTTGAHGAGAAGWAVTAGGQAPAGPLVLPRGGSGGDEGWRQTYWVWPLPPAGRLTLAVQWLAAGVPEVLFEVDAEQIVSAAARSQPLW